MRQHLPLSVLAGLLFTATPALAQTPPAPDAKSATEQAALPDARTIVDRMIEFQGGRKAFSELPPLTSVGTFGVPSMNISGTMRTWTAPPDLMKVEMDMPALGKTLTGYDGKVGWSIDPSRGPSLMSGDMLAEIRREADRMSDLDIFNQYESVRVLGRENFKDTECVVLELKQGETVDTRLIEEATGRPVANRSVMPSPMGEIPATTVFEAWMNVGPMKIPSRTTIEVMGMQQVITIDKVTPGPIEASVFALPPAIQALVRERETKTDDDATPAGDQGSSGGADSDSTSSDAPSATRKASDGDSPSSGGRR